MPELRTFALHAEHAREPATCVRPMHAQRRCSSALPSTSILRCARERERGDVGHLNAPVSPIRPFSAKERPGHGEGRRARQPAAPQDGRRQTSI